MSQFKMRAQSSLRLDQDSVQASFTMLTDNMFNCRTRGNVQADCHAVVHGFTSPLNLIERYHINSDVLSNWAKAIAEQYQNNSYHNWLHAVDVFQFCYQALSRGQFADYLNYQDVLA